MEEKKEEVKGVGPVKNTENAHGDQKAQNNPEKSSAQENPKGKNAQENPQRQSVQEDSEGRREQETPEELVERKRWLFFGLPFTFTKYTINEQVITINEGLLNTVENDCYLYKIQDVVLKTSLMERIFGLGTVACYTGDNTHPQLFLEHIRHAKEIKDYILHTSEEARRKRRTLNTLNINADDIDDDL